MALSVIRENVVGTTSLTWFSKENVPPCVVNLLIRWRHGDRWAYTFAFNMGDSESDKMNLLECRDGKHGPRYDDCQFLDFDWEWAVLPTNYQWDETMKIKGYIKRD